VGAIVTGRSFLAAENSLAPSPELDAALRMAGEQLANPAFEIAVAVTLGSLLFVFWREVRRLVRI